MLEQDKTNVFDDFGLFSVEMDLEKALIKSYFLEVEDNNLAVNLSMGVGEIFLNENDEIFTADNIPQDRFCLLYTSPSPRDS